MDLLRFTTAGNVDDGKSTLIGRLLYDSKAILEDQLAAVEEASARRGFDSVNLALLTDGLKAEREQGITIDVAYRYFTTPRRKFIIADCPGHLQYTRNMVTGASGSNLAIVLVDARRGLVEQTRRHCFVASLLRIPHLVICVNKMDLVEFSQEAFEKIRAEFEEFSRKLEIVDVTYIPISALQGDNVVEPSTRMLWYRGRTLLAHLEDVHIASDLNHIDFRFPVQGVIRPRDDEHHDYRGYTGQIATGGVKVGDPIVILPAGFETQVAKIESGGVEVQEAVAPHSATLQLAAPFDVSRGDMIVRPGNRPACVQDVEAMICWMGSERMDPAKRYLFKHTTSDGQVIVREVLYKIDINTLSRNETDRDIALNDFAKIKLRVSKPLLCDPYRANRSTGSFILIDPDHFGTVAAGMILGQS